MKSFISIVFLSLLIIPAFGQDWTVPADKKAKLSTFKFTDDSRKAGEQLYNINCKSCHGTPGMGNFQANLNPQPPDPVTEKLQKNTDGELYYKIITGRGPMPSFKNSLSANEIWNVVSFLRTFKKDYVQAIAPIIRSSAYPGAEIVISLLLGPGNDEVSLKATAVTEKSTVPVTGAAVRLFVNRTFGKMMIDEEKETGKDGIAIFKVNKGLPGDTAGNLRLSAGFVDEDAFGTATKDTILKAGVPVEPVSLTKPRAMWNVVRKAPIWILLTYTLGVLGVWGFIFLILLKLRDIFIIGEHLSSVPAEEQEKN
ncbi:MAG: cytochrome c [Bacteroidales bacterium]